MAERRVVVGVRAREAAALGDDDAVLVPDVVAEVAGRLVDRDGGTGDHGVRRAVRVPFRARRPAVELEAAGLLHVVDGGRAPDGPLAGVVPVEDPFAARASRELPAVLADLLLGHPAVVGEAAVLAAGGEVEAVAAGVPPAGDGVPGDGGFPGLRLAEPRSGSVLDLLDDAGRELLVVAGRGGDAGGHGGAAPRSVGLGFGHGGSSWVGRPGVSGPAREPVRRASARPGAGKRAAARAAPSRRPPAARSRSRAGARARG